MKREVGFDHIETAAEMDAQRFRTNLVSEPFYSKVCNTRWPHNSDELILEMRVNFERLRMEIVLSQPAPRPQCGPSPRRLPAVNTGRRNLERRDVRPRSVRGRMNPEYRELKRQRIRKKLFLFKPAWMVLALKLHKPQAGVYSVPT